MDWHEMMIEKSAYDETKNLDQAGLYVWGEKNLPAYVLYGYGFYGIRPPFERDGEYYLPVLMGSSCD